MKKSLKDILIDSAHEVIRENSRINREMDLGYNVAAVIIEDLRGTLDQGMLRPEMTYLGICPILYVPNADDGNRGVKSLLDAIKLLHIGQDPTPDEPDVEGFHIDLNRVFQRRVREYNQKNPGNRLNYRSLDLTRDGKYDLRNPELRDLLKGIDSGNLEIVSPYQEVVFLLESFKL